MTHLVAAIDCGTNSIKVLIGSRRGDGTLDVVLRDSRVVRLGQGVDQTGRLADEALERTFAAIDELGATIRDHGVDPARTRFCATSATRDASNAAVFAEGVRRRLGVEPEVLSGDEEAALVFAGAIAAQSPMPPEPVLVVDIGGGSTELVLGEAATGRHRSPTRSPTRSPWTSDPCASTSATSTATRRRPPRSPRASPTSTSTSTGPASRSTGCGRWSAPPAPSRPSPAASSTSAATTVTPSTGPSCPTPTPPPSSNGLVAMTVDERRALPYMHPGRADVIGAGALIWSGILARVPVPDHLVSEADILHGIAAAI